MAAAARKRKSIDEERRAEDLEGDGITEAVES